MCARMFAALLLLSACAYGAPPAMRRVDHHQHLLSPAGSDGPDLGGLELRDVWPDLRQKFPLTPAELDKLANNVAPFQERRRPRRLDGRRLGAGAAGRRRISRRDGGVPFDECARLRERSAPPNRR